MSCRMLDGEERAAELKKEIAGELENLRARNKDPHLVALQVGENAASRVYLRSQQRAFDEAGIAYTLKQLPGETPESGVLSAVRELNDDDRYTGIIVQMPLPSHVNARAVQETLSPVKDVEAITPTNIGKLVFGDFTLAPCTASAAIEVYNLTGESMKGKEVVVVGHSEIVGKPLALMMLGHPTESATPTICHIATRCVRDHTLKADVVFVAVGKPGLIRGNDLKQGAVIIDIGINRIPLLDEGGNPVYDAKGKPRKQTVGDVDFASACTVASAISPVPGGVGPLTVTMLLRNTVRSAALQV
ncbi:MAG: bifunctional 5,10-methylenetetrahydrofolate dehydrogenase/5,10-methenyltetrahydrofolate cyclohydrolase [Planctomycetes bacterium]|nr:bifunctional 5,10-methylenetetrahydrofolate dehydrogenase/5,10-methenyltetrahydrofolate cyclohydrolase [Planctomycetota bacterium]